MIVRVRNAFVCLRVLKFHYSGMARFSRPCASLAILYVHIFRSFRCAQRSCS